MPPRGGPDGDWRWAGPGCGCGRRARRFDNGDLRLVIMQLLSERPRHGYEIIKALGERVGGGYLPSPGVVYPTLALLEDLGQATVSAEHGGRRLHALTEAGRAALAAERSVLEAILARLDGEAAARAGPPGEVVRALDNLVAALRLRLRAGRAGEAEIRAITAAIDRAARAVEEA